VNAALFIGNTSEFWNDCNVFGRHEELWICRLCNEYGIVDRDVHLSSHGHAMHEAAVKKAVLARLPWTTSLLSHCTAQYHAPSERFTICPFQWTTMRTVSHYSWQTRLAPITYSHKEDKSDILAEPYLLTEQSGSGSDHVGSSSTVKRSWASISPTEATYSWSCRLCNVSGLKASAYWLHCLTDEHTVLATKSHVVDVTAVQGPELSNPPNETSQSQGAASTPIMIEPTERVECGVKLVSSAAAAAAAGLAIAKVESDMTLEIDQSTSSTKALDDNAQSESVEEQSLATPVPHDMDQVSSGTESDASEDEITKAVNTTSEPEVDDEENNRKVNVDDPKSLPQQNSEDGATHTRPEPKHFTVDELKELVKFVARNSDDDNWSCSLCNISNISTHKVKDHCLGGRHYAILERTRQLQELSTFVTPNTDNHHWTCRLCAISNLQSHSVQEHCLGKRHATAHAAMKRNESPRQNEETADTHQPAPAMTKEVQEFEKQLTERARTDLRFGFMGLSNNAWSCSLCQVHGLKMKDVEPHCLGKRHTTALRSREPHQQAPSSQQSK
jgi:hypothetical protein